MSVSTKIIGFDEAKKMLQDLPLVVQRKAVLSAQKSALAPALMDMKNFAKLRVNDKSGRLTRSIGYKSLKGSTYNIGSLVGYRFGSSGAPHAHLVESGTTDRYLKRARTVTFTTKDGRKITASVRYTGKMPAANIMHDAIKYNEDSVMQSFQNNIGKSIEKVVKRHKKKFS